VGLKVITLDGGIEEELSKGISIRRTAASTAAGVGAFICAAPFLMDCEA